MTARELRELVEKEFPTVVESTTLVDGKLRVFLIGGSYIDFWWSTQIPGRYAHHWERKHVDGTIYRHDNMPHPKWSSVNTFPKHFHNGSESNAIESTLSDNPIKAIREFMRFVEGKLGTHVS